jgi:hypothetical protein
MNFRVGQKVVCVDAKRSDRRLEKGAEYQISEVFWIDSVGELGVGIAGVPSGHPVRGWRSSRFRPIVERKTDITVFTEILRKATKPARTPAISLQDRQ